MEAMRKPFQGVLNIIRFNWHFYVIAAGAVLLFLFMAAYFSEPYKILLQIICILVSITTAVSLLVSFYVYDISDLYKFKWLNKDDAPQQVLNINAGFDETSVLLKNNFKNAELIAFDFYDPQKHTEVSIKRARKTYPAYPGTQYVETNKLPLQDNSADKIFLTLAAHEIRDEKERIIFFKELNRVLKPNGEVFITEHLRDVPNFLAYNIGFLHFYSKADWHKIFMLSDFTINKEIKLTPFISTFILRKNENAF